jgi:type IV pilus assembly protein PilO
MNDLRRWFTVLNLHLAGAAALAVVVLVLAAKAVLAFNAAGAIDSESYREMEVRYAQLNAQMSHLQGLPQKVAQAREDAGKFDEARIAPNYSTIAQELGAAAVKNQVRLSNTRYSPSPADNGLTEVRIDASLSGDYTPMMHFINDLERDTNRVFFIIDGLTFTGQQGGLVNLRLRLSTYLHPNASDLPPAESGASAEAEAAVTNPSQQEVR